MNKHSFIGNMWKAAVDIKECYDYGKKELNAKIIQRYVDNKYCYLIISPDNIIKKEKMIHLNKIVLNDTLLVCRRHEEQFQVKCKLFVCLYHNENIVGYIVY